jgi:hypothetical protein
MNEVTISETTVCKCIWCGQSHNRELFPQEPTTDMFNIVEGMNRLLLIYRLIEFTKDKGFVDFDDFRGLYTDGLEVMGYEVTAFGTNIGLLEHYEDECYYVNEALWKQIHDHFTQLFTFHKTTI